MLATRPFILCLPNVYCSFFLFFFFKASFGPKCPKNRQFLFTMSKLNNYTLQKNNLPEQILVLQPLSLRIKRGCPFWKFVGLGLVAIQSNMKWNLGKGKIFISMFFFFHMVQ